MAPSREAPVQTWSIPRAPGGRNGRIPRWLSHPEHQVEATALDADQTALSTSPAQPLPGSKRVRQCPSLRKFQKQPAVTSLHLPFSPSPALPAALPALSSVPRRLISKPAPARCLDVGLWGDHLLGTRWRRTVQPHHPPILGQPHSPQPPAAAALSRSPDGSPRPFRVSHPLLPGFLQSRLGAHTASFLLQPHECIFRSCSPHQQEIGKKDVLTTVPERPSLVILETNLGLNLCSTTGCFSCFSCFSSVKWEYHCFLGLL